MSLEAHKVTSTVERVNPNMSCYAWKIDDFSKKKIHYRIRSPVFSAIDSKVKWWLELYPNGEIKEGSDHMLLGIYYFSWTNAKVNVELSIVNVDNEVMEAFKLKKELELKAADRHSVLYEWVHGGNSRLTINRRYVEDPKNRILAEDCLTISFNVTFDDPMVKLPIICENSKENFKGFRQNMFDDFGQLLENGKFSDVKFVVGNKEIHAHKAILASRSPVFDAMFQHKMQENEKNVVVIVDIEYAVMMELFRFIYTDTVANIELMASDLLVVADKYCIKQLKALCEKSLLNTLNIDNAIQRLIKAEHSNSANLKNQILEFIVKHSSPVVEKEDLASLPPYLMYEIIRAMAPKVNAQKDT